MHLLLINNNPAVSRLINLSAKKYGYEIEEFKGDDFDLNKSFDVTIADNEAVSDNSILLLKESGNLGDIIYVGSKGISKPAYANYFLQKPFLPTDFIDMIKKIEKLKKEESKKTDEQGEDSSFADQDIQDKNSNNEENFNMDALDLDELDSLDLPMPDDDFVDNLQEENSIMNERDKEEIENEMDINNIENIDNTSEDKELEKDFEDSKNEADIQEVKEIIEVEETVEKENDKLLPSNSLETEEIPQELKLDNDGDESDNSILDSEDIDEVKQLLNEDELSPQDLNKKSKEKDDDSIDGENILKESNILEAIDDISEPSGVIEDMITQSNDLEDPQDILEEIQTLQEQSLNLNSDETPQKEEFNEVVKKEKNSIDDLSEDDLEELFSPDKTDKALKKDVDISELQEELQTKITKDVKKVLEKDEIREALKGLKVNISISFDEE